MRVEVISDFDSLIAARPAWTCLVDLAGVEHPFLGHDWICSWWEAFGADKDLHVLFVKDGDELVGIAPLMISRNRMYGLPVREMGFIYNDHTPQLDLIVSRDHAAVYDAIWRHLWDQHEEWDILKLCQLASDSPSLRDIERLAADGACHLGTWLSTEAPYIRVNGNFNDYFATLPKGLRLNLKRRLKRLEEQGQVEFEILSDETQIEEALAEAFHMEEESWKGSAGTAINCRPELQRFYSLIAHRAASAGTLYFTFLRLDGRRIAFDLSLIYKNTLFKLKPGYSQEYSSCSPGQQLTTRTVRDAFERGLTKVDFLGWAEPWKLSWTKTVQKNYWAFVFQKNLLGWFLYSIKFRLLPWLRNKPFYEPLRDGVMNRFARNTKVTDAA